MVRIYPPPYIESPYYFVLNLTLENKLEYEV